MTVTITTVPFQQSLASEGPFQMPWHCSEQVWSVYTTQWGILIPTVKESLPQEKLMCHKCTLHCLPLLPNTSVRRYKKDMKPNVVHLNCLRLCSHVYCVEIYKLLGFYAIVLSKRFLVVCFIIHWETDCWRRNWASWEIFLGLNICKLNTHLEQGCTLSSGDVIVQHHLCLASYIDQLSYSSYTTWFCICYIPGTSLFFSRGDERLCYALQLYTVYS